MYPYPNGPFGNMMPYSDFHCMNLDWVIQIAKNFLDQYTHIQEIIDTGLENIDTSKTEALTALQEALTQAETDLAAAYNNYSSQMNTQLTNDLAALTAAVNAAYTQIASQIDTKAANTLASIPDDYTTLSNTVSLLNTEVSNVISLEVTDDIMQRFSFDVGTLGLDGAEASGTTRIRSQFVDITDYLNIVFTPTAGYKYNPYWYDSNKNFISLEGWKTAEGTYTPPINSKYIRLLIANTSDGTAGLVDQRKITGNAHYTVNKLISKLVDTDNQDESLGRDIILDAWKIGYVYGDGAIAGPAAQPNYMCTQSIQKKDYSLAVTPALGYRINIRFFDNSNAVLYSSDWVTGTYYIPAGKKFIINVSKVVGEAITDISEYIGNIKIQTYMEHRLNNLPTIRKIAILGDSTSTYEGYSETGYEYYPSTSVTDVKQMWWYLVAEKLGCIDNIDVSAISRTAYYDINEEGYTPFYNDTRIARLATNGDPDMILIYGGINDGFFSQTGSIVYDYQVSALNALSNSTIKGIALTIRKLQTAYPNAKLVLMIPQQVNFANLASGYTLERTDTIAKDLMAYAEMFGVYKVIDLRKCGINMNTINGNTEDNAVHPNVVGMRKIANYIIDNI